MIDQFIGNVIGWSFFALILVHIVSPIFFIYHGVQIMFSKKWEENEKEKVEYDFMKVFEQLGEAIPQVIIAIVFYSLNKEFVDNYDHVFGFSIPTTLISIIFSAVSLVLGIKSSCSSLFTCFFQTTTNKLVKCNPL